MTTLTYNLKNKNDSSDQFYLDLKNFTNEVLSYPDPLLKEATESMKSVYANKLGFTVRTQSEYLFELLMLGIFWSNYHTMAIPSSQLKLRGLKTLFRMRKRFQQVKPAIDTVRGLLISRLRTKNNNEEKLTLNQKSLDTLLLFLEASGDYWEEAKRLREWQLVINDLNDIDKSIILQNVLQFAEWFQTQAAKLLGDYTENVDPFIKQNKSAYNNREDRLLCLRVPNEYHLNMVGAQIMNEALLADYKSTKNKVVLIPTCMCSISENRCKAKNTDLVRECIGCNKDCNIGRIKQSLQSESHSVFLIPHSSNFSRFLRRWEGQTDTALIGVACVPNLIMGGYEMQSLHIPSQCVFLDYCGCQKHWSPAQGIPTNLNLHKLHFVLNQ
jgi:uncharacterized protein